MSKKSVVLFIFFMVLLVLPFLFYFAWQEPAQVKGAEDNARFVDNGDEITKQEIEQKENKEPVVSASNSAVFAQEYGENSAAYVTFAPGVTAQMQDPQYWLEQCENPQEILWTSEEIRDFNRQVLNTEGLAYNIFSPDFRETFQSELLLGKNEIRVSEEWEYGICVNRGEIKMLPQEAPVGEDAYFDENLLTTARTNTPVLVDGQTGDGAYYHVIAYDYQGWTLAENIALCSGLEEWEQAAQRSGWLEFAGETDLQNDQAGKNILIVTVPRLRLEITGELLTMGTTMRFLTAEEVRELMEETEPEKRENGGEDSTKGAQGALADTWGCYVVELAGRTTEGRYVPRYETIPISAGVSMEYLTFTRENLLNQMFSFAGQVYGWGGSFESVDCSGLVQDVMASFGILFPRDAGTQQKVPLSRITFTEDMGEMEREAILNVLCPGDLLYFPGHIMFYLGQEQGEYYVFNAVSSFLEPQVYGDEVLKVRRVITNTLSVERKNGNSWLQELERAVLFSGKD